MQFLVKDVFAAGKATATAGTPIVILMPRKRRLKSWISVIKYTCGSIAHLLTIMRALGSARLAANAAAGQNQVVLLTDPSVGNTGALSSGDYVVLEDDNGVCTLFTISAVSGTVPAITLTLSANLPNQASKAPPTMAALGKRLWYFGTPAASGHLNLDTTANTTNTLQGDTDGGLGGSLNREEPLVLYSPNATAAGIFEQVNGTYLDTGTAV